MSIVETEYQRRIAAMPPKEKIAASMRMLQWTRQRLAREITAQHGSVSPERLRWLVALRMYGDDPIIQKMIEERLHLVPN